MPAFANPFQGNVDRKLNKEELIQALRLDIAGELEAIYLYDAHVQATDIEIAKKVLADIRDEEKAVPETKSGSGFSAPATVGSLLDKS